MENGITCLMIAIMIGFKQQRTYDINEIENKYSLKLFAIGNILKAIDEIGCIHSIQGYDLNYAFVILGRDIGYDKLTGKIIVHPENYYDKNGKQTAGYEELLEYNTSC